MKRTLILAAVAASLAAPLAASPLSTAIQHFNQDAVHSSDVRLVPGGENSVSVSTRNGSSLATAFEVFNADEDFKNELRGVNGATVYSQSQVAADIFAAIRAESLDDE